MREIHKVSNPCNNNDDAKLSMLVALQHKKQLQNVPQNRGNRDSPPFSIHPSIHPYSLSLSLSLSPPTKHKHHHHHLHSDLTSLIKTHIMIRISNILIAFINTLTLVTSLAAIGASFWFLIRPSFCLSLPEIHPTASPHSGFFPFPSFLLRFDRLVLSSPILPLDIPFFPVCFDCWVDVFHCFRHRCHQQRRSERWYRGEGIKSTASEITPTGCRIMCWMINIGMRLRAVLLSSRFVRKLKMILMRPGMI
ncbi:hypothetical protein HYC85_029983 [Camellia sinensis]|uniref:Transmembrane protein n=1 Tax=Camellia sinensis TaxID=4442 RepID=A0A7J7FZG6_CAMSI|nr:hypothetical protein HYC85_029983 [Camellia sinensis]